MILDLVREAVGNRRVLWSRGLPMTVAEDLRSGGTEVVEIPVVGCAAAPPDARPGEVLVGGHPNELGGFDTPGAGDAILLVDEALGPLRAVPGGVSALHLSWLGEWDDPGGATAAARRLARSVEQLRGVRVACRVVTPLVVVLLPVAPDGVSGAVPLPTEALRDRPELPGGIRVRVPDGVDRDTIRAYAAALAAFIEGRAGGS